MKIQKYLMMVIITAAVSVSFSQTVLLEEKFESGTFSLLGWGDGLNAHNAVMNGFARLQSGGINVGRRAFISRNTGSDGSREYNGAKIYNFFDHPLEISLNIANLEGKPDDGKRIAYFAGIGYGRAGRVAAPADLWNGISFMVEKTSSGGFAVTVTEQTAAKDERTVLSSITKAPAKLTIVISGNKWKLVLDDVKKFDGVLTLLTQKDFGDSFYFWTGLKNAGPSLTPGSMDVSNIKIVTP